MLVLPIIGQLPRVLCVGRGEAGACSQGDNRCSPLSRDTSGSSKQNSNLDLAHLREQDSKIHPLSTYYIYY